MRISDWSSDVCSSDLNEAGAHLVGHADVAKVTFTGSTDTGRAIMGAVAPTLKRLTLELGGNDAAIVLPDADVKTVAPAIFAFAFFNSGQVCAIIKRLYVHDSLYDAMCEEIVTYARGAKVAGGRDPEAQFGPVQNKAQYDKVLSYLEGARASGQIIAGGDVPKGPGYFVPLTVVRSEEHTSELQSLMSISYAVFCLKKKNTTHTHTS